MLLTFFLILTLSYSLTLKNDLGSIYLTNGESHRLSLSNYFSGNNLSFSITNSNTTQNSSKIHFAQELKLLSFTPYQNPAWNKTWSTSTQQHIYITDEFEREILVTYNENYLLFYQANGETRDVNLLWAGAIESPYKNPQIKGIRYRERYHPVLIIWVIGEESNHNAFALRNDIYILNATDLTISRSPVWTNFSEIAYASDIVLGDGGMWDALCVFCKFVDGSTALYVYDIKNIYEPALRQKIYQYDKISTPNKQLEILGIFTADYTFCVLDKNYGLVSYRYEWQFLKFSEAEAYDMRLFGSFYSLQPLHEMMFGVIAESGAIIFQYTPNALFKILGMINIGNSSISASLTVQASHSYFFLQSNDGILSIVPKWKSDFDVICSFDLEKIIGKSFEKNGIFEVFSNMADGSNYYARFDRDGVRVFMLNLEEWSLEVWGDTNYFIEITAIEQNGQKLSNVLNVISIPAGSQEILPLNHYEKSKIYPTIEYMSTMSSFNYTVNSFFSGPNLSFKIENSHSEHFSFEFTPPSKPLLSLNISLPNDVTKVFLYDRNLVKFYPDKVDIDEGDYINTRSFNVSNPIAFCVDREKFYAIYSEPLENSYIISFFNRNYYATEALSQTIESTIKCKFFEMAVGCLLCADKHQIDIYIYKDAWMILLSLTGENFDEGFSWNLIDVKFSKNFILNYLYLLDQDQGVLMLNLEMIIVYNTSYFYEKSIKENDGIILILPSKDYVGVINENGWIDIYNYPLTYLRRVFLGIPNESILNIAANTNMIYVQVNNSTYIYDIDQPSHNSLFYTFKFSQPNTISSGAFKRCASSFAGFFPSEGGKYIEIYSMPCPIDRNYPGKEKCGLDFQLTYTVSKKEKLFQNSYPVNIAITAFNENSSLTQYFPINLITSGLFIHFESYKWKIKENIPYNERYEMDLDDIFIGQNMTIELSVNEILIANETEMKSPVILPKRIEQVGFHKPKTHVYSHIVIPNNLVVITSESGIFVTNATDFSDDQFYINITEITKLNNLICAHIDWFPYTKNNQILFITSCTYQISQTSSNIDNPLLITARSLILWEFDYENLSITQFKMINATFNSDFLRLAPLDENSFEIMALSISKLHDHSLENNEIFRFRGSWLENNIDIRQVEIINFFTLNLSYFYTKILDFNVKNSESVYWYALDQNYGIRIIETGTYNSLLIASGPSNKIDSPFISLGRCEDFLFISNFYGGIESYQIKNYVNLELDDTYYIFSAPHFFSIPMKSIIACSEDLRYIATPIYRAVGEASIAVFDRNAKAASNSIANIFLSQCYNSYYVKDVKFVNKNTLSVIGCDEKFFVSYKINENKLIFPDFDEDEYFEMEEKWGTKDFRLFITAKNDNDEEISSIAYFRREGPENNENSWWIWAVLSVGIVSVFMGGVYGVIKVLKAKKSRPMNSFLMQELRRDDDTQN